MSKKILFLEAYYGGSHKRWADELRQFSRHEFNFLCLPARHWKWRMHGAAISFAKQFLESAYVPDIILATDMVDLNLFLSICRSRLVHAKCVLYFHENQLTYPRSLNDSDIHQKRDNHYAFINYSNSLSADIVLFNSRFHKQIFLSELTPFLKQFPDFKNLETIEEIRNKSSVLPVGINFKLLDSFIKDKGKPINEKPILLWNHRWEYDKNPTLFFKILFELDARGIDFQLIVLGECGAKYPTIFDDAQIKLKEHIIHWGYCESYTEYLEYIRSADIQLICSKHDFFGISVVEAMYLGVIPLLPDALAYPEHVPDTFSSDLFYSSEVEIIPKLRSLIRERNNFNREGLKDKIKSYDWTIVSNHFDQLMDSI